MDELEVSVIKPDRPLGLLLQEKDKMLFINDILNDKMTALKVGDQLLEINNITLNSIHEVQQIIGPIENGKGMVFKIKRPNESSKGKNTG